MQHDGFFRCAGPFTLADVARHVGGEIARGADPDQPVEDVRALDEAGPQHLSFFDNPKYARLLEATRGGACLIASTSVAKAPAHIACIVTPAPYHAFARSLMLFYPDAMHSRTALMAAHEKPIHPSARIGAQARIEPGAVVGPEVQIGAGSVIAAGALIGYRVVVGEGSYVGPGATLTHAIVGKRAIIHAGARIGQDGFGFAMGKDGHLKVPQIGRVLIGDDVEVGANTTIDRGALKDTIIGQGTKIDNLVQIGHNVVIGRHCIVVGQSGIAGSTVLGDFVVMGGQSGVAGHLTVGDGAQLAGNSSAMHSIPAGEKWAGTPAIRFMDFARELAAVRRLAAPKK